MTEEIEYFEKKRPDRTYISKGFPAPEEGRTLRFISKTFDHSTHHELAEVGDELVIRVTEGQRDEVKAIFYEDDREVASLIIQRFTRETGVPHKVAFSFHGDEIDRLRSFLQSIAVVNLPHANKIRLDDDVIDEALKTVGSADLRRLLSKNPDLVLQVAREEVTSTDVVALSYRRKQLELFERLLSDDEFFLGHQREAELDGAEAVWQDFFERNPWVFGYGLQYVFTDSLDKVSLERVVAGFDVAHRGKRVDALLRTRGAISTLCFVELKRHDAQLLEAKPYRPDCWQVSRELAGAIAQVQKTVHRAIQSIGEELRLLNEEGEPVGSSAYLFTPRAYVVVGNLAEFIGEHGVNLQKLGSFELFRRGLVTPEIVTYDELLERARNIVEYTQHEYETSADQGSGSGYDTSEDELDGFTDDDATSPAEDPGEVAWPF